MNLFQASVIRLRTIVSPVDIRQNTEILTTKN